MYTTKDYLNADSKLYNCIDRIFNIEEKHKATWGDMKAVEMMEHCLHVQDVLNGLHKIERIPFSYKVLKNSIRSSRLSMRTYKESLPTLPEYMNFSDLDIHLLKKSLKDSIDYHLNSNSVSLDYRHPILGNMCKSEKIWCSFKHLDHHLRQFNV